MPSKRRGSKPLNSAEWREMVRDNRVWTGVGVVVQRPGDASHYEILTDDTGAAIDVLVEVDLMPQGEPLFCRLCVHGGSLGNGIWKIPAPGTEVMIAVPQGDLEADPAILCELSSGGVPSELDGDTLVIKNAKAVKVIALQGDVTVDAPGGQVTLQGKNGGVARIARKDDPVNVGSFNILGGVGNALTGIQHIAPDGTVTSFSITGIPAPVPCNGKVKDGSSKAGSG